MRAEGFLREGPADTYSLLSNLMGKCSSHLVSVSKAEGHSVQKADSTERHLNVLLNNNERKKLLFSN